MEFVALLFLIVLNALLAFERPFAGRPMRSGAPARRRHFQLGAVHRNHEG